MLLWRQPVFKDYEVPITSNCYGGWHLCHDWFTFPRCDHVRNILEPPLRRIIAVDIFLHFRH